MNWKSSVYKEQIVKILIFHITTHWKASTPEEALNHHMNKMIRPEDVTSLCPLQCVNNRPMNVLTKVTEERFSMTPEAWIYFTTSDLAISAAKYSTCQQ